ncbi:MAG: hypothetical protein P8Q36_07755 [Alphaproteobacteria bacterium]|jgi:hypothetical protein|nr:hypothetical protein [Rhodospirillaceae bacterium]MBT6510643.1 hypothetical protein [Rhodospirillaceae bacterium]MBT7611713.1 hypothetical protein [Rhodospirillaceae bacterium]MBT7646488.1 hypothetical protein [Rhodospirillaceae bacterium]MDG2480749.1 hypothetical protein [Alphaproteobacteria bacterium]
MLHSMINDLRAWHRREKARVQTDQLYAHLRSDIGLPQGSGVKNNPVFNPMFSRT